MGERALDGLRSPLYRSGYALLANAVGTTAVGVVYWAVAAHLYSRETLGRSAALIAALMLASSFAQLNLHSALPRFLPRAGRSAGHLITYSYAMSSLAALAVGLGFVMILPRLSSNWRFLGDSVTLAVAFVAATVVWGVFNLEDAALVGLHRSVLVAIENTVYAVCKLLLLMGIAILLPLTGIFVSWVVPLAVIVPVINWLIFRRYLKDRDSAAAAAEWRAREVVRFASIDYVGALTSQASWGLMPLLVLSALGAAANASFYIAWTIAAGLNLVAANFAYSLLVEGVTAPHRLAELTRGVLVRCAVILLPAAAVLIVAARPILRIYGSAYATNASVLLGLLALAAIPCGLLAVALSLDRLESRVGRAVFTQGAVAVLTLGGGWLLLRRLGINGIGLACLVGYLAGAAARSPTIIGVLRRPVDSARESGLAPFGVRHAEQDRKPTMQPLRRATVSGLVGSDLMGPAVNKANGHREHTGEPEPAIGFEATAPMPSFTPATWTVVVDSDEMYYERMWVPGALPGQSVPFPPYSNERRFRLTGNHMRIGRRSAARGLEPEIDLTGPPTDPAVSRLHAVLIPAPDGTWGILDPGSANGTLVNGRKIAIGDLVPLHDGDCINLGVWTMITVHRG
jgi:O-antigen/teichoic acid export membrane protein